MADRGDTIRQLAHARWRERWGRLGPLGRNITVVLVVKFAALGLLWWAFFSHPAERHLSVDSPRVEAHLVPSAKTEQFPHAKH